MTNAAQNSLIRSLPVDGPFEDDEMLLLAAVDLEALSNAMRRAPVDGPFTPGQALALTRCPDLNAALAAAAALSAEEQGPIDTSTFLRLATAVSE